MTVRARALLAGFLLSVLAWGGVIFVGVRVHDSLSNIDRETTASITR